MSGFGRLRVAALSTHEAHAFLIYNSDWRGRIVDFQKKHWIIFSFDQFEQKLLAKGSKRAATILQEKYKLKMHSWTNVAVLIQMKPCSWGQVDFQKVLLHMESSNHRTAGRSVTLRIYSNNCMINLDTEWTATWRLLEHCAISSGCYWDGTYS